MMAGTLDAPSVAQNRMWSAVLPTAARCSIVTPRAASNGTRLPCPKGSSMEI